jgi:DNA-binding GntR family transcriptional regulator
MQICMPDGTEIVLSDRWTSRPLVDSTAGRRSSDVYEGLRDAIVSGKLRPNEPLIEDDLAKAYTVSRTPIREAFQKLSRDGLIVPRKRGWAVREFTRAEVQENYEIRADLEGLAARLATTRGSPAHKSRIQQIHRARLSLNSFSVVERVRSNRDLHDAIAAAAQNNKLSSLIFATGNFYFNQRTAALTSAESFERAQIEHEEIVDAIVRGDADRADIAMRAHILRAMTIWLATADTP